MRVVLYASIVGNLMFAILCIGPNIWFVVIMVSRYQSNPELPHWVAIKHILKYLWRKNDYMLVYQCEVLITTGYIDSKSQSNGDSWKSTLRYVLHEEFVMNNYYYSLIKYFVAYSI
jgi:hypothetical protein